MTPNIAAIIRQHVSLEVRCLDRVYLHAWMPKLQTSGGLCYFLQEHLGHPIPSPALFRPLHDRFVSAVPAFTRRHGIPLIAFEPKQRKDDVVAAYRQRFAGREGVVVIGVAQEKMRSFKAQKRSGPGTKITFDTSGQSAQLIVFIDLMDVAHRTGRFPQLPHNCGMIGCGFKSRARNRRYLQLWSGAA
jgi:hypothetical protein